MKLVITTILIIILTIFHIYGQSPVEVTTKSGLKYTVLKAGSGELAKVGQEVVIYESMGYLSGKQFYSIEKPAPPIKFTLGKKQVIDGVDEAVTGMKVGEIRKLIVPPALSKRNEYPDYLSKDSTLVYKVELVEIRKKRH
ncbi:MAG: FKBP-type peptidyl-prolyl cis-trans isomerase [Terrimonas sp.]|nr:FKBP-type peptidyl-prolyl cis-trans isomerase [Terrimonas sp.]